MRDYYRIIGVNNDASIDAIKQAYRQMALREHPDKGGDARRMALLNEAYDILSHLDERKTFDQDFEVFNASHDTEIRLNRERLDCLPTAGIAFSESFKQQHEQFVKQYGLEPLDQNQSSSYLKAFSSDLYSCVGDDLFSFIKAKGNDETKLDIGLLSPEKAVLHFINFLKGDYYGNNLKDLSRAFYRKIKNVETSGQQAGSEFQLYNGIYTIFLVAAKNRTPTAKILFSLLKITDYAKHNVEKTIKFMAPLLQSKYFRSLFSQALHYYWLSEESDVLDGSFTEAFVGQAATERLIESLKSKLSENQNSRKSNIRSLRSAQLLFKLERDLGKSADTPTAVFYRQKAFHLLDWLPAVSGLGEHAIAVNTFLQIGTTLQKAAAHEQNPILRMADEKLAVEIYRGAVAIGYYAKPDVELYACLHSVKLLLSCRYNDSEFKKILEDIQQKALWIADLFPFFQTPQPNADFLVEEKNKTLVLMRQLLHTLIDMIEDPSGPAEIDHSYVRVFYQAYEACLKNWYQENCDPEKEKRFRQRLMQELLVSKQWTIDDLDRNLKAPWPLNDLDEQGWTCSKSSILSSAKEIDVPAYKSVHGVEFSYNGNGEINFILDYCKDTDSNDKCLLTSFDLSELIQRRLTFAVFSLDPVDPYMPYHPFNKTYVQPSSLHYSQLLHTMFITDYLLKFLAIGQEVQRRDPYELRSLDEIVSRLPDHLKKVIYDFHASSYNESAHRFWIEAEKVEYAEGDSEDGKRLFAVGNIRMVVKKQKMIRDAEGNLVDKEGENEGWDCYVLNQEQEQELYDGKRIIKDSALIIIKDSWELTFWENQKVTYRFTLEENRQDLILLSELQRDSQEKVKNDNSDSLRKIYRIVMKAAEKIRMPHNYSPEFIFVQEFTKYYDEFAIYFPEFGRLRELSKAVSLIQIMAYVREKNQEQINLIKRRLNYYQKTCGLQIKQPGQEEHNYWQKTREKLKKLVGERITKQLEEWRSKYSEEKLKQKRRETLNDIRRQIGTLSFTRHSPEIQDIRDQLYKEFRSNYIDAYGLISWGWYSSVTCDVYKEKINPEIPGIINRLEITKARQCREQLLKHFDDELDDLSSQSASALIDKFLKGNDQSLLDRLVYYDRMVIAKKIKEEVFTDQTVTTIDRALNNNSLYPTHSFFAIRKIVDSETEKTLKEYVKQLDVQLIGREKLEQSFIDLDFGSEAEEVDLEGNCSWVPASFRHYVDGKHSRIVCGGVSICPKLRECVRNADKEALLRQTNVDAKRLQQNRLAGNAVGDYFAKNIVAKYHDSSKYIIKTNCYFKTKYGRRYLDVAVIDKKTGKIVKGYEAKIGDSPYTRKQQEKDKWLFEKKKLQTPVKLVRFRMDPNLFYAYRMSANPEDCPGPLLNNAVISKGLTKSSHTK